MKIYYPRGVGLEFAFLAIVLFGLSACSSDAEFRGATAEKARQSAADVEVEQDGTEEEDEIVYEPVAREPIFQTIEVEAEFQTSRMNQREISFQPDFKLMTQQVTLLEGAPLTTAFTQPSRASGTVEQRQGKDAESHSESHNISEAGLLDVLVVMDDSTSMRNEQALIAERLLNIVSTVQNTNWQIGIVTTSDPCLREGKVVGVNTADPAAELASLINGIVLDPTVVEYGFPMAIKALKGECKGVVAPWIREDSAVAVLIVSDEDNCGSHSRDGCPGMEGETAQQMVDFLANLREPGKARIYGLIEGQANTCSDAFYAPKYRAAIDATGGKWGSICGNAASYTATLTAISEDVSRIISREFKLAYPPAADTIKVFVDDTELTSGFSIVGDRLVLDAAAPDQIKLVANYFHSGLPKFDRLALPSDVAENTVKVMIDGVLADPNTYTFDAGTFELFFNTPPSDLAMVRVDFRKGADLPKSFNLGSADLLGLPVKVEIDGVATTDFEIDSNMNLVLANAPSDGQKVSILHRTKSGRVTDYPLVDATSAAATEFSAVDMGSGDPVAVTLVNDKIVFSADDVVAGRMISIEFELGYADQDLAIDLAGRVEPNSVSVQVENLPSDCKELFEHVGSTLKILCGQDDLGKMQVAYEYLTELVWDYELAGDFDMSSPVDWRVYIDDVETKNFTFDGLMISLPPEDLPDLATVRIKATQTLEVTP